MQSETKDTISCCCAQGQKQKNKQVANSIDSIVNTFKTTTKLSFLDKLGMFKSRLTLGMYNSTKRLAGIPTK